jgi:hypothetical protein
MVVITFDASHILLMACCFHLQATEQNSFNLYRQATAAAKCADRVGLGVELQGQGGCIQIRTARERMFKNAELLEGEHPISPRVSSIVSQLC